VTRPAQDEPGIRAGAEPVRSAKSLIGLSEHPPAGSHKSYFDLFSLRFNDAYLRVGVIFRGSLCACRESKPDQDHNTSSQKLGPGKATPFAKEDFLANLPFLSGKELVDASQLTLRANMSNEQGDR
jgi:hypothetical protein